MMIDKDSMSIVAQYSFGALNFEYKVRQRGNFIYDENGTILNDTSHIELINLYEKIIDMFGKEVFSVASTRQLIQYAIDDDRVEILDWIHATYPQRHENIKDFILFTIPNNSYSIIDWLFIQYDLSLYSNIIFDSMINRFELAIKLFIVHYGLKSFERARNNIIKYELKKFSVDEKRKHIKWLNNFVQ